MASQRGQARVVAAGGLHPRLVPRASAERAASRRPAPDRFPSYASGTPPSTRTGEIRPGARAVPHHEYDDFDERPTSVREGRQVLAELPGVGRHRPSAPAPLPGVAPREPSALAALPGIPEAKPPERKAPAPPPRPEKPAAARAPAPLADAAKLRPAKPAGKSDGTLVRTLMTIPADEAAIAAAAAERGVDKPETAADTARPRGWLLAVLAAIGCAFAWLIGPLTLGVAVADPRVAAGALAATVLAPLLGTMLMAAILRARGYRGWRSTLGLFALAILALAAAWAARLAGPVVFELGPSGIAEAWSHHTWMRGLDALTAPHLLAAWAAEALGILALVTVWARRLRRPPAR